jgi:ribonuclease HI
MQLRFAIDGACRRNGKPDCISAGGLFIQRFGENGELWSCSTTGVVDYESTNQRGELLALIKALSVIVDTCTEECDSATIVTDSEYIFNAMTKNWIISWESKGWITAEGNDVKNKDLWMHVSKLVKQLRIDIAYYHIKGHTIPFGKVTANKLIAEDVTGRKFLKAFKADYDKKKDAKAEALRKANELSMRNNDFALTEEMLKDFVSINAVADAVANYIVDEAERNPRS